MPIQTNNIVLDAAANELLVGIVKTGAEETVAKIGGSKKQTESTFQDFSAYNFLLEPIYTRAPGPGANNVVPEVNPDDMLAGLWLEFLQFADSFAIDTRLAVELILQNEITTFIDADDDYIDFYDVPGFVSSNVFLSMMSQAHSAFSGAMAPDLYAQYRTTTQVDPYLGAAQVAINEWLKSKIDSLKQQDGSITLANLHLIESNPFWEDGVAEILSKLDRFVDSNEGKPQDDESHLEISFDPFLANTVNFGLQISYRQSWIPMGTQAGEIVRTLPLGPKQTEKISIKAVTRTKRSRKSDTSTSIESSTEGSVATKDSVEVIEEAGKKNNYSVEAGGSYGLGSVGFGASLKASASGESSSASKDTKANLNETMEKTASKLKQQTKIIVSTEIEETSEFSQVSEISNPNEELAVTYIYSRLQRQYEIQTRLAEVNTVVFVAEMVPSPSQVNAEWIRKHDWKIAEVLLDESYSDDLQFVTNYESTTGEVNVDGNIAALMESVSRPLGQDLPGIPDYSNLPGQIPDIFQTQQLAYEREVQRQRENRNKQERYERALQRMRAHIVNNILHYCRNIWQSEDPDIRFMRYSKKRIPIHWEFSATQPASNGYIDGYYSPSINNYEADTVPLSDLVNPAGPIGFVGNYAAYYIRQSDRWSSLHAMLSHMQTPYIRHLVSVSQTPAAAPESQLHGVASDRRMGAGVYRLVFEGIDLKSGVFHLFQQNQDEQFIYEKDVTVIENSISFHAIKVRLSGAIPDGTELLVTVETVPILEDPELKSIRWHQKPLTESQESSFYSEDVLKEFGAYFSGISVLLSERSPFPKWHELSTAEKDKVRDKFYAFLLRKRYTRLIALDTNNVVLSREMDTTSTLEPFKLLHRMIDVLSSSEEMNQKSTESERRRRRLVANLLGDPEVEKLTVVAGVGDVTHLAALDGLQPDTEIGDNGGADTDEPDPV